MRRTHYPKVFGLNFSESQASAKPLIPQRVFNLNVLKFKAEHSPMVKSMLDHLIHQF